jgi:16S rRNA (uracil1498-N3)-methyltransferase
VRRIRVPLAELRAGRLELSRDASHYLCVVHRLAAGARFVAFDVERALEAEATLVDVERGRAVCEVDEPSAASSGSIGVSLLQGAAKGDRLEQVVRGATALGVESVHVVITERSVVHPAGARVERLRAIALDAARQSGRGDLPRLETTTGLDVALAAVSGASLKICLAPGAEVPLAERVRGWKLGSSAVLLIGPEGGLTDLELDQARASGFVLASMGKLTLRTELAAVAALGCFAGQLTGS